MATLRPYKCIVEFRNTNTSGVISVIFFFNKYLNLRIVTYLTCDIQMDYTKMIHRKYLRKDKECFFSNWHSQYQESQDVCVFCFILFDSWLLFFFLFSLLFSGEEGVVFLVGWFFFVVWLLYCGFFLVLFSFICLVVFRGLRVKLSRNHGSKKI